MAKIPSEEPSFPDPFSPSAWLQAKLSLDQRLLARAGGDDTGTIQLFVQDLNSLEERKVSFFSTQELTHFYWSFDSKTLLMCHTQEGKIHLSSIHLVDQRRSQYIPPPGYRIDSLIQISSHSHEAVIALKKEGQLYADPYLLNIETGHWSLLFRNLQYALLHFDETLRCVFGMQIDEKGSALFFAADAKEPFYVVDSSYVISLEIVGFDAKDRKVYLLDSLSSDMNTLKRVDIASGDVQELSHLETSDIADVLFLQGSVIGYAAYVERKQWFFCDPKSPLWQITAALGDDVDIFPQDAEGRYFVVIKNLPEEGSFGFLYDTDSKQLRELLPKNEVRWSPMHCHTIQASDGRSITSYYTLPRGVDPKKPPKALPLVVFPHGGPLRARDSYQFHPLHQLASEQGYIALSINFRLSGGFGLSFARGQEGWAGRSHLDMIEVIGSMVEQGIVDASRIAMVGSSYGGYETLMTLALNPKLLAVAVAICPVSDVTLQMSELPLFWWQQYQTLSDRKVLFTRAMFQRSLGIDPSSLDEKQRLERISPLYLLETLKVPLFLFHGAKDAVVSPHDTTQLYDKLAKQAAPVSYTLLLGEGHRIKAAGKKAMFQTIAAHLKRYLQISYSYLNLNFQSCANL